MVQVVVYGGARAILHKLHSPLHEVTTTKSSLVHTLFLNKPKTTGGINVAISNNAQTFDTGSSLFLLLMGEPGHET